MPASKRRATRQPVNPPPAKFPKTLTSKSGKSLDDLEEELALSKEAFNEQEETIKYINKEAEKHETLIFAQHKEIQKLKKFIRVQSSQDCMAYDYAKVLDHANGQMSVQVKALKERNAFLESELLAARKVLLQAVPGEAKLKKEVEKLVSEKEAMTEAISAEMEENEAELVEKEKEVKRLQGELRVKKEQLHKQVLGA